MKHLEEHIKTNRCCPFCRSTDFSGDEVIIEGTRAMQECSCYSCGKTWTDIYILSVVLTEEEEDVI